MLPGDRQNVERFFIADSGDIGEVHQSLEADGCLRIEPALPNAVQLLLRVRARQHLTLGHERHELGVALDVADDIVEVILVVVEDGLAPGDTLRVVLAGALLCGFPCRKVSPPVASSW